MSLLVRVAQMVTERGVATADVLYPELQPEGYTRRQVVVALQNARYRKLIESDGGGPRGGKCAKYWAKNPTRRVNSVFSLGQANGSP